MLLADVVDALEVSAGPSKRARVVEEVARLLARSTADQVGLVVGLLSSGLDSLRIVDTAVLPSAVAPAATATLTIDDVAEVLVAVRASSSALQQRELIIDLLSRSTEREQHLLRWIAGAEPSSQIDESLMISAIAAASRSRVRDVRRAVALRSSLAEAARVALFEGGEALERLDVRVGRPVRPMESVDSDDLEIVFASTPPTVIDWDIDGRRLQAHRSGRRVWLFAPTGEDVTDLFPALAPIVLALPGGDLVVDAVVPRAPNGASGTDRILFTDLLVGGSSLMDRPLTERRSVLASIAHPDQIVPSITTDVRSVAIAFVFDGINAGHRRVLARPADGTYEPGTAVPTWHRIVPRFNAKLLVIGAQRGVGSRLELFAGVDLGARGVGGQVVSVGRVVRGISTAMLEWQTERFASLALEPVEGRREIELRPELVAEVEYDGVESGSDAGQPVLRSPRIVAYLEDAGLDAVSAIEEVVGRRSGPGADERVIVPDVAPRLPPALAVRSPSMHEPTAIVPNPGSDLAEPLGLRMVGGGVGSGLAADAAALIDLDPYVPPALDERAGPARRALATRVAMLAWALVVTATVALGADDRPLNDLVIVRWNMLGGLLCVVTLIVGAGLTDQRIRNLHLLGGRTPSRSRSVTAWTSPAIGVALMEVTVTRMGPTPGVDVRPAALTLVFAIVMWRPYSLLRRLLGALIRVRWDVLLTSAYLVDLVSIGLLWRAAGFGPELRGPLTPSGVDGQIGVLVAASIAFAINVPLWHRVTRALDDAQAHRAVAQRTHHEHRMLRLRNIDPTDPDVWWMLVRRRSEEEHDVVPAQLAPSDEVVTARGISDAEVDALVDDVRRQNRVALRQLGANDADRLLNRLRTEYSAIGSERTRSARNVGLEAEPLPAPSVRDAALDRHSKPARRPDSIDALLREAGTVEIGAALAEQRREAGLGAERRVPPRLYGLDSLRLVITAMYALMTALASMAFYEVVTAPASVGAAPTSNELANDLERGAVVFVGALVATGAFVPLWVTLVVRTSRRAGYEGEIRRSVYWLAPLGVLASIGWMVSQVTDAGEFGTAFAGVAVATATMAVVMIEPLWVWLGLKPRSLVAWVGIQPAIAMLVLASGALSGIETPIPTQRLVVVTLLLALGSALAAVFATLATVDVGDELRSSRTLSVPSVGPRAR